MTDAPAVGLVRIGQRLTFNASLFPLPVYELVCGGEESESVFGKPLTAVDNTPRTTTHPTSN